MALGDGVGAGVGDGVGVQARNVPPTAPRRAPPALGQAHPEGSCSRVDPGVEGHPSSGVALSYRGAGRRGDRDRLGRGYGATGKRGASTEESEVKFAFSESSQPGPSAQFPAPLDVAARLVTEYLARGDQGAGSHQSGRSKVGVCTEKRESAPGQLVFPKLDTRTYCPAAGAR